MDEARRVLAEADEAYRELQEAVVDLDDARAKTAWLGTWGVREILVHIAGWDREMTPALDRIGRGEAAYPAGAYDDADGWNARFVAAREGVKLADVLAEMDGAHRGLVAAAGALGASHLAPGAAARELFEGTAAQHYREHAAQIREWREGTR